MHYIILIELFSIPIQRQTTILIGGTRSTAQKKSFEDLVGMSKLAASEDQLW